MRFEVDDYVEPKDYPQQVFQVMDRAAHHSYSMVKPEWGAQLKLRFVGAPEGMITLTTPGTVRFEFESSVTHANAMLVLALESR